jgi:DNA gyrase/topoisomerase IV subunit A
MKIKSIKLVKLDHKEKFYDITVDDYQNFSIGDSKIVVHNSALGGAINKLARPFGNAIQLIDGGGFFGTEVSPSPAAPRYTRVKLSSIANNILNKYNHLTTRVPDGPYNPLWLEIPIGLVMPIVGIAVGYKTMILPRKLKDIQDFLEGKRKNLKPYFEGFKGTIEKHKGLDKSWLISSNIETNEKKIMIREIPPVLKYTAVLKKLDYLFNKFEGNIRIKDDSKKTVNIDITYTGKSKSEWDELVNYVQKIFSIVVTESLVFVKDGQVLVYDSVEQYLEDFKWQLVRLKYRNTEYEFNDLSFELKFNIAKELFIQFILAKKRSNTEIDVWLKDYDKKIGDRLERMTSRKFTSDESIATRELIKTLQHDVKEKEKEFKNNKKAFESILDPTLTRGIGSKKNTVDLFDTDDMTETKEGILIWDGSDVYENEENKENENSEDE